MAPGPRMEVLVRMTDEFGNEVLPAEFMRAAERHKLMRLVDRWVVQTTFTAVGRGVIAAHRSSHHRDQHLGADAR